MHDRNFLEECEADMSWVCRGDAMLVIGCSEAVTGLCYPDMKACTFVDGPANATVQYVSEVAVSANIFYHIQISWEVSATSSHEKSPF